MQKHDSLKYTITGHDNRLIKKDKTTFCVRK